MNSKFFTNEESDTLLNKIKGVFEYKNIYFFDALVGYFRASGYFQIRDFVEKAAEIRVLVGINIGKLVLEAHQQGLLFDPNAEKAQEEFFQSVRQNIQEAKYDRKVEDGMLQLIEEVVKKGKSKTLYSRVIPVILLRKTLPGREIKGHNLTCKLYEAKSGIIRIYLFHEENKGRVIVVGGLKDNQDKDLKSVKRIIKDYQDETSMTKIATKGHV
ncbi:MAG: hypothetical protein PWQ17_161 [Anaerophaga sp.]|nr:hypothetical protein [Anaerophaga sp.]MDK2840656.1 hypothetical protein [Anaerophaga sp.]MDN5290476.1 hypothetical protein [Anaerophaga sp.]